MMMVFRHEKHILKLKQTLSETDDEHKREKAEIRKTLEKSHSEERASLDEEMSQLQQKFESRNAELLAQIDQMKQTHEEELTLLENEKEQNLLLADQEQSALKEKISQLNDNLEDCQKELEKVKRNGDAKTERDRGKIAELNLEISRLKVTDIVKFYSFYSFFFQFIILGSIG